MARNERGAHGIAVKHDRPTRPHLSSEISPRGTNYRSLAKHSSLNASKNYFVSPPWPITFARATTFNVSILRLTIHILLFIERNHFVRTRLDLQQIFQSREFALELSDYIRYLLLRRRDEALQFNLKRSSSQEPQTRARSCTHAHRIDEYTFHQHIQWSISVERKKNDRKLRRSTKVKKAEHPHSV